MQKIQIQNIVHLQNICNTTARTPHRANKFSKAYFKSELAKIMIFNIYG